MDLNFNSDSTYCSLYENSQQSQTTKYKDDKIGNSKLLDKVHNEICLHWEGKKLMGKIEAMQYMKQITKMKLKSYKDRYFAEKIKSSLLKIFNLAKEFERSLSIAQISEISDPIQDCLFTEDIGLTKDADDPKQILLGSISVNADKSFPLDLLTNNNFVSPISPLHQVTNSQERIIEDDVGKESIDFGMDISDALTDKGNGVNSLQLFSSGNSRVYSRVQNCSESQGNNVKSLLDAGSENFDLSEVHSSKKYIAEISDKITINEIYLPQTVENDSHSNENNCEFRGTVISSDEHVTSSIYPKLENDRNISITGINNNSSNCNFFEIVNKPEQPVDKSNTIGKIADVMLESLNSTSEETYSFIKDDNFTNREISETMSYEGNQPLEKIDANVIEKIDLKKILGIGNSFTELYNTKINELCYGLGSESGGKTWQEIQKQLEYGEEQTRAVINALDTLFAKLCVEEREAKEEQFMDKQHKENLHNFSPEDERELDLYNLSRKNYAKLDKISEEFKVHINIEESKSINNEDDDDYDGLDWRILLS